MVPRSDSPVDHREGRMAKHNEPSEGCLYQQFSAGSFMAAARTRVIVVGAWLPLL